MKKKRTSEQWHEIMRQYSAFEGPTVQFCREFDVPQQSLYSQLKRRQLLSTNKRKLTEQKQTAAGSSFVKAQVTVPACIVLKTQHATLSLPSQCDPRWLANLLKGLAA